MMFTRNRCAVNVFYIGQLLLYGNVDTLVVV